MCCNSYITYVSPGNWRGVNFQLKLTEVQLKKRKVLFLYRVYGSESVLVKRSPDIHSSVALCFDDINLLQLHHR